MQLLWNCYATALQLLCNCSATAMQLLCNCYANAMWMLYKHYASTMETLCKCLQMLCKDLQTLFATKVVSMTTEQKKNLNGYWTKKISMTTEQKLVDTNQRQKKNLAICRSVSWALLTLKKTFQISDSLDHFLKYG